MLVAKQVADLVTLARGLLAFWFARLGFTQGEQGLPLAVWLLFAAWTGDALDGPIARRSRVYYHTWLGDHDLEIDLTVSAGLLVYMLAAGYVEWHVAAVYILIWALVFLRWGFARSLGMLIQAPIYAWFIWVAVTEPPFMGWWLVGWIVAAVVLTWPRFPNEVIPGFLSGIRSVNKR